MHNAQGKVPNFKMKPKMGPMIGALAVLLVGVLFWVDAHRDPGDIPAHGRSNLFLAVSLLVSGLLVIVATGRMWFKHLWHDRYGRKSRRR